MDNDLATVDHIVSILKGWLNLQEWNIYCEVTSLPDDNAANVTIDATYMNATIRVDSESVKNESKLWSYIIHEFVHILHSEFELFEKHMKMDEVSMFMYMSAMERSVVRIERIITRLLVESGKIPG